MLKAKLKVILRTLLRHPSYSAIVVLSLGLAIASNTILYSVLDALIHPKLAMREPSRLFWIRFYGDSKGRVDIASRDAALATAQKSFEEMAAYEGTFPGATVLEFGAAFKDGPVAIVDTNFFRVLGTRPLEARFFVGSDANTNAAIINEKMVSDLFPAGTSPLGKVVAINSKPYVVVGVAPERAVFPGYSTAAWVLAAPNSRTGSYTRLVRLKQGTSRANAEAELSVVAGRIAQLAGEPPVSDAFRLVPAADPNFQLRKLHWAMIAAVLAILVVASANVANLQLARGVMRRHELAVRTALGADRRGIFLLVLGESAVLAAAGLLFGLIATFWADQLLLAKLPTRIGEFIIEPQWSWRVLVASTTASLLTLAGIGVIPAIRASRADPLEALKAGGLSGSSRKGRREYTALVSLECAFALALVCAAAVATRSAADEGEYRRGYDPSHIVRGQVSVRSPEGSQSSAGIDLENWAARLGQINGVSSAAVTSTRLVDDNILSFSDETGVKEFPAPLYAATLVSRNYFETVRMPIALGQDFTGLEPGVPAVVVDSQTARLLWPNSNPIGMQVKLGGPRSSRPFARVIGIVGEDPRFLTPRVSGVAMGAIKHLGSIYYWPGLNEPADQHSRNSATFKFFARMTSVAPGMGLSIRHAAGGWPEARVLGVSAMAEEDSQNRSNRWFIAAIFVSFAALAVGLATFGVYGIISHSVAQRRQELAVRMALGATRHDLLSAVLRETTPLALSALALGLAMTKYGLPLLDDIIRGNDMYNAPLFGLLGLSLLGLAVLVALVPALSATRISPASSLRG